MLAINAFRLFQKSPLIPFFKRGEMLAIFARFDMINVFGNLHTDDRMQPQQKPKLPTSYSVIIAIFLFVLMIGGCVHRGTPDGPPNYYVDVSKIQDPVPHYVEKSKYGNPSSYWINGREYHVLKTAKGYNKRGIASWYGTKFDGRLTSSREKYNLLGITAASPELPIPC